MGRRRNFYSKKSLNAINKMPGNKKIGAGIFACCLFGIPLLLILIFFISNNYNGTLEYLMLLFFIAPEIYFGITLIRIGVKQNKEEEIYQENLYKSNINKVDTMTGKQFEDFVGVILTKLGYETEVTQQSRDFGADLVVKKYGKRIVIQTKCYSSKVSLSAIQEVYTSMYKYRATECWVVTNNYFTKPAKELASSNGVVLVDRDALIDLIVKSQGK